MKSCLSQSLEGNIFLSKDFKEVIISDELIIFSEKQNKYISFNDSTLILWNIIKQQKKLTKKKLIEEISKNWIISQYKQDEIFSTLNQLCNLGLITYDI